MITVDEITRLIQSQMPFLKENFSVSEIGIFGSYVHEDNDNDSDVDILVEFSEPIGLFDFIRLEDHLSGILGLNVDLVPKGGIKPQLKETILNEVVYV